MMKLTRATQCLWAKKAVKEGSMRWLPLWVHLRDAAGTAEKLWHHWLSQGIRNAMAEDLDGEYQAKRLLLFLAAAHDLGKATPVFQAKRARPPQRELDEFIDEQLIMAGVPIKDERDFSSGKETPHALASQVLLERGGCHKNITAVLGAHHGKPAQRGTTDDNWSAFGFNYHLEREGKEVWGCLQKELMDYALHLAGFSSLEELPVPSMPIQVLLSGILIMVDWIASNEDYFPYIRPEDSIESIDYHSRVKLAWDTLNLSNSWKAEEGMRFDADSFFKKRFPFSPNPFQKQAVSLAEAVQQPGIMVIEAPMGKGKTEAALACAEIFAQKTKRSGLFFALPTQATTDGIFPRLCEWINKLETDYGHTIHLAHGKAQFNETFQALKNMEGSSQIGVDDEGSLLVHQWFEGQKKALLADFVAGTIDQLLMAALRQKHVMLRHLGLAGKVVIIDECHAYDAYMSQYLHRALQWLGVYGVPVIILSATLPAAKRQSVIDAYLNTSSVPEPMENLFGEPIDLQPKSPQWVTCRDYPLLTYTDGSQVKQQALENDNKSTSVAIDFLQDEELVSQVEELLETDGCVGIMVNTVKRSQEIAEKLREHFGSDLVRLLHSRFLAPDRIDQEKQLLRELGKPDEERQRPRRRIVVGTQVMEQSLDIDFDVLITDIAPMDLLLQRMGRLHRHERKKRPQKLKVARCYILGCLENDFETGTKAVYGDYLLMRTKSLLPSMIHLPNHIPSLVQDTYDEEVLLNLHKEKYFKAKVKHENLVDSKEAGAKVFRLGPIWIGSKQNLEGWLDVDMNVQQGEAAVRDSDESMEVLLLWKDEQKKMRFLPWQEKGIEIDTHQVPPEFLGKAMARQRIRLPNELCYPSAIEKTIRELELMNSERISIWQQSTWLRGELFLILDSHLTTRLNGYRITYSQLDGLKYEKEALSNE